MIKRKALSAGKILSGFLAGVVILSISARANIFVSQTFEQKYSWVLLEPMLEEVQEEKSPRLFFFCRLYGNSYLSLQKLDFLSCLESYSTLIVPEIISIDLFLLYHSLKIGPSR